MKLTMEIKAKKIKFQELYQTLYALLPTIRKHKGCRDCHIYTDTENEDVFFLYFSWDNQLSLEHYLRSNSGSALMGAIEVLSEKSRVKIGCEEPWQGIEILHKMRKEIY
ncbi:MAG: antibiotic biosynthesis monooxygenase [Smithellaceae bacterium]|jgi:quinol monooxygenase YgiN